MINWDKWSAVKGQRPVLGLELPNLFTTINWTPDMTPTFKIFYLTEPFLATTSPFPHSI